MVSLTSATDMAAEAAGGPKPSTSTGMTRARSGTFSSRREWTLEETFKAMARSISDCPTDQHWSYMCESVLPPRSETVRSPDKSVHVS